MEVKVDNVSFGYDRKKNVLNGISLNVKSHETLAIVGASGCGKSTFLRILCGIIPYHRKGFLEGTIFLDGRDPLEYIMKGKIGFMFQDPALFPNKTVRENIRVPLRFLKVEEGDQVDEMLNKVGLRDYEDYLPSQLSGGMKTRVALARTLITKPSLLLLDEPFASLDIKWKYDLYKELEILDKVFKSTKVLVTHDIQEALLLANHIVVLGREGRIVEELRPKNSLPSFLKDDSFEYSQKEFGIIKDAILQN
jgi:ABC-type nitrate/sulfonate/bicarbonate transport system ATPase subunit